MFVIALIGTLVTEVTFFSAPQVTFAANFTRLSAMKYASAITAAGLPLGFAFRAILTGSIFAVTNFLGFFSSSSFR